MVDIGKLFERIQTNALDSSVPLADTLRLCIAVGGNLGAPELIAWARSELDGYPVGAELPSYRTITAPLQMDYVNGNWQHTGAEVTSNLLDEEVRQMMYDVSLREPLHQLEVLARDPQATKGLKMSPANGGILRAMVHRNVEDNEFLSVTGVYWNVTQSSISAVVDAVRTRLVAMVATFDTEAAKPGVDTQSAARSAITVIAGSGANVTLNHAPEGSITSGGDKSTVSSNRAGGDGTVALSGRDMKDSPAGGPRTTPARRPRFWQTAWWTVGRLIVGAISLTLAAVTAYLTWVGLS